MAKKVVSERFVTKAELANIGRGGSMSDVKPTSDLRATSVPYTDAPDLEEEKEKQEIPRIVNFKGEWVIPDEKHIEDQLRLASCLFDVTFEFLVKKLHTTKQATLTDKIWARLENTLSYHVRTPEQAQELADEYGYHYNDAMFGYMNDREVTLPVIVYKKGENPYVVSGETELLFASAFKIKPKVLMILL